MSLKRLTRAAVTALLAAGAAAGVAGVAAAPASAAPIEAAASGCIVQVTLVKAWNLQEPPQDEIYLRVGSSYTSTRSFVEFQERPGADFGDVTEFVALGASLPIAVWEADWPSADEHLGTIYVPCTGVAGSDSKHVTGFSSNYEVWYRVSVVG
ncbi:MAG TPA: hypothetical protein VFR67_09405 [Pilimelia sp.]|nr:hypothetical protein [Pilimelia sp.]